jgi:cardiolipin synthase
MVSKLNTGAQIVFACLVLFTLAFGFNPGFLLPLMIGVVAVLTFLSIAFYLAEWIRHVGSAEGER